MQNLKRIRVSQLQPGAYLCGFEGSWLDRPFLENRILMRDATDVMQAKASGFEFCWIASEQEGETERCEYPRSDTLFDVDEQRFLHMNSVTAMSAATLDQLPTAASDLYENTKALTKEVFAQVRLGKAVDISQHQELVNELFDSISTMPDALLSIVRLKEIDDYTYAHCVAVSALMIALARTLGLGERESKEAGLAGYLHDIGKAFIPEEILNKPGKLTPQEFRMIQRHSCLGHAYLSRDIQTPKFVLDVCLHHHEKLDGTGYPHQQRGRMISRYARMAAVCDVYDALTSPRPYKAGWDPAEAISAMASWKGHFDRNIFLAFVKTLGIYPVGSSVRLRSGLVGRVVKQNRQDLTRPFVEVSTAAAQEASDIINLAACPEEAIIGRAGRLS